MACTIHANSASDALDALVNAALMAGENVPERVVRKVFSSSINLVVHLDRGMDQSGSRIIRETMEIRAVVTVDSVAAVVSRLAASTDYGELVAEGFSEAMMTDSAVNHLSGI